MVDPSAAWRVTAGSPPDLDAIDPRSRDGAPGDKAVTQAASRELVDRLADLQGRLWAEQRRSLLVVLQALDAGGKDGTIRKVFTGVNPQGVRVWSFRQPSETERAHDFLWRIHHRAPAAGEIAVFNRSHYEDVLVPRVEGTITEDEWKRRYRAIRDFEQHLTDAGTTVVKLFLHISKEEQAERFRARLDKPEKRWKFSRGDLGVRERWDDYHAAYTDALGETSTDACPWWVVPADHKWYRDWVVLQVLVRTLAAMDPQYPPEEPGLDDVVVV